MIITINGENIDYTLEQETTVGDAFAGVSSWLEKSGMVVGGIRIDGSAVLLSDADWRDRSIADVESLDLEALSLRESRVLQLETARDFFLLLKNAADAGDRESLGELSSGYPDLRRILPYLVADGPHSAVLAETDAALERVGFPLDSDAPLDDADALASEAARLAGILEARRREAANPEDEARRSAESLAKTAPTLDDVAVNLQTGRDKQAMETIITLADELQVLMRSLGWCGGGPDIGAIADDLNGILQELEEALKAGDTVLIGDLLEYEIKPRLLDLPERIRFDEEDAS